MDSFDVFLSYSAAERAAVEAIALKLKNVGVRPWLDAWKLIPGEAWQPELENALSACSTCAVFIGKDGIGPWQNEEMRAAIQRRVKDDGRQFRVIPVILPNGPTTPDALPLFLRAATWVQYHQSLDDVDAFERLLCGIRGLEPGNLPSAIVGSPISSRVEVEITIVGEPSDFRKTARAAEALLQRLSGDQTLTIKYIRKGSIKVRITCSPEASQKLARLHEGGQFDELLGFRVTGLREFAPPSAPSTGVHDLPVRIYEELFIVKPDASEESIDGLVLQLTKTIEAHNGHLDRVQKWGVRRLAYRVAGVSEGYYVLAQFSGVASIVKELERRLRISDLILKFITVRIDEKLNKIEKRKKAREKRAARSTKLKQPSPVHDDFESEERVGTGAISDKIQELLKQSFGPD